MAANTRSRLVIAFIVCHFLPGDDPGRRQPRRADFPVRKAGAQRNESVQLKLLEFEANRHKYLAEGGIFEPDVISPVSHEENNRQNTVQQQLATLNSTLDAKNNLYDAGLEAPTPCSPSSMPPAVC